MASTTVSLAGDREFVLLLKALAASKGITLAKLTRGAIDAMYGDELNSLTEIFAASSVAHKQQIMRASNGQLVTETENAEAQS